MRNRSRTLLLVAQPLDAGVPHHVRDLLPAALADGWRVQVACPQASVLWGAAGELASEGVTRFPISAARAPSPGDAGSLRRLLPLVKAADVVHAHSSKAGLLARLAARMTSRTQRVVFTPHAWSFWAYPAFLPIERLAAHWCRAIVCVSDHERAAGLDARVGVRQQYAVIPNGVDLDRFAPAAGAGAARTAGAAPPDGDRLVMVGRLANQRRHDLALRALAALRARHRPGATLELVGDGPLRPSLEQLASELGIADAVSFLGERSDVPDRLRAASVVIHATRYEGASLGVIEAMASGRPVVASGVGGMDELVDAGVTGYLCGEDPHEWADLIDRALAMRVAMGQAARARAEARFSLAGMTASTLDLYNRVAHAQWEPGSTFHG